MSDNLYKRLSEERKQLQEQGLVPEWYTTGGWQLFKEKYLYQTDEAVKGQFKRIAQTASKHLKNTKWETEAEDKFFDLLWKGWLSPSTPVLANMGTDRGLPISCSGTVVEDSVDGFYSNLHEVAMLTKYGFGTASDMSSIRPRGSKISVGGKANGVVPVIKEHVNTMRNVSQGSARRGAWAAYLDIEHGDFYEVADLIMSEHDDLNIGWTIKQTFIDKLQSGDKEANLRFQKAMKVKLVTGKGYFFFVDKANEKRPAMYKDLGLLIKNSQLCVAPETLILTDEGYQTISDLENKEVNVWNGLEYSKVTIKKTGVNQKLIKVVTNSGFELECTPYHKFYVYDYHHVTRDIKLVEKRAHELQEGDELIDRNAPHDIEPVRLKVVSVVDEGRYDDTYCFTEPKRGMGVFNGILTGQCSEIMLFNDEHHTYTCCLSSMNVAKFEEWKDTDAVYWATIFLDCVISEFLDKAEGIPGLEKAIRFTEKGRALGLGQCGFHTLCMQKMIPFESFDAHMLNLEIADHIDKESLSASKEMAVELGEPDWCCGYGVRNTHRIAIAPTKSTALLMGGVSEGINPDPAMSYNQLTAAGEVNRINPVLLDLMKQKGVYSKKHIQEVTDKQGSVQHVEWLTDDEKAVFKTAFEINQKAILRLASTRAKYIDQWQSLNLFFAADEYEAWVTEVHQEAFLDPNILGLYYIYTQAGIQAAKGDSCEACQ